jgi:hypothetical protein
MKIIEPYPLIPMPFPINGPVHGELYINGSLEYNCLSFRFVFNNPEEFSPLAVNVRAAGKNYTFYCLIRENINGVFSVKTPLFQSPFYLGDMFTVTAVEGLVKLETKTNVKKISETGLNPGDL